MSQLNTHQFKEIYDKLEIDLDSLGCIMLDLEPVEKPVEFKEYKTDNAERFWINGWVGNKTPHVTLLYGLLENNKSYVDKVLQGWKIANVVIDSVGYFESPYEDELYYCIVAHLKPSELLIEGHQRLELLPHINTFTGYKPHFTLGYCIKNESHRDLMIEILNSQLKETSIKVKSINYGQ